MGSDGITYLKGNLNKAINCCLECKEEELGFCIFWQLLKKQ